MTWIPCYISHGWQFCETPCACPSAPSSLLAVCQKMTRSEQHAARCQSAALQVTSQCAILAAGLWTEAANDLHFAKVACPLHAEHCLFHFCFWPIIATGSHFDSRSVVWVSPTARRCSLMQHLDYTCCRLVLTGGHSLCRISPCDRPCQALCIGQVSMEVSDGSRYYRSALDAAKVGRYVCR